MTGRSRLDEYPLMLSYTLETSISSSSHMQVRRNLIVVGSSNLWQNGFHLLGGVILTDLVGTHLNTHS